MPVFDLRLADRGDHQGALSAGITSMHMAH